RRHATIYGNGPDLNLRLDWKLGWIWRSIPSAVGAMVSTPYIHNRFSIAGERDLCEFLPIILRVRRNAARLECRTVCNVDIPHAFLVKSPRDGRTHGGRDQVFGRWEAENLLDGERSRRWLLRHEREREYEASNFHDVITSMHQVAACSRGL